MVGRHPFILGALIDFVGKPSPPKRLYVKTNVAVDKTFPNLRSKGDNINGKVKKITRR
jgi:hypothetical protein